MTTQVSLKALVQGAYDVQKLRVAIGNRVTQSWYQIKGVSPGEKPKEKLDAENQKLLARIKAEHKGLLGAGVARLKRENFTPTEYLPDFVIFDLCTLHRGLEEQEELALKMVERALDGIPIYEHFLKHVTGCGRAMSGVLLSTLDIHKAERPSQFWKYAGMDVGEDNRGRSRRAEHLVPRPYINRDGKDEIRNSITFNPFLRTKLFVLATCFMRNNNPLYRGIYNGYKHRLEHHVDWKERTPGHRNNAARRYMLKMFLLHLWETWRRLEGLPVVPSYAEGKLGLGHRDAA